MVTAEPHSGGVFAVLCNPPIQCRPTPLDFLLNWVGVFGSCIGKIAHRK